MGTSGQESESSGKLSQSSLCFWLVLANILAWFVFAALAESTIMSLLLFLGGLTASHNVIIALCSRRGD